MAIRNEILIGADSRVNGLIMYRKVNDVPFSPQFYFIDDNTLSMGSNIEVRYIEYYKDSEGVINPLLVSYKTYIVPNIDGWEAANGWFMQLARTPITAQYGVLDSIEATLGGLPIDVPNGYHLTQP